MTPDHLYHYKGRIMRVVDGDTLDIEVDLGLGIKRLERVRLAGIDAPETRSSDQEEKAAGRVAHEFVVDWVRSHGDVLLRTVKDGDKYGRFLAYVYPASDHSMSLNDMMVENKMAVPYVE